VRNCGRNRCKIREDSIVTFIKKRRMWLENKNAA
jgi:hypothetical protein